MGEIGGLHVVFPEFGLVYRRFRSIDGDGLARNIY